MNELGEKGRPFFFVIDFLGENPVIMLPDELDENDVEIEIPGFSNQKGKTNKTVQFYFNKFPVDFDVYQNAFERVKHSINRGDTFLLNLTFPTKIETDLSLRDIFAFSKAKYKIRFRDQFVVFSPEPFVNTVDNTISTFPMKGTIDAGIPDAVAILMNDTKEIAEHNTIIDLLRNDLSRVAEKVRVKDFRYIENIKTHEKEILQTSSKITGILPDGWQKSLGDMIFSMLPAGSISGAPKLKTLEIIREVEVSPRGFFTGIFGYFDGQDLDTAVMIRFIERTTDGLVFRSGGGITCFSDCKKEYNELIDKVYVPIV